MAILEKTTLKAVLMVVTGATASIATSGAILPFAFNGRTGSFLLTLNPASLTITQGSYSTTTITLVSINGYSGNVNLYANTTLPVSFGANPVSVPADGTATTTLTVTAPKNATLGGYSIIVIGLGNGQKKTISSTALFTAQVTSNADFTILADPSIINNLAGTTNTTTIIITSNNYTGSVDLSFTAPFGFISLTGGQNPVSLTGGGTATTSLQIKTMPNTMSGIYTVTVTGTGGQETYSTTITLVVIDPATETLVLTRYVFSSSTNLTLHLQNTGNATITLQSYSVSDNQGNAWTFANWNGPFMSPGSTADANILIWTDCPSCAYTGIFGLFTEFVAGRDYTVTLTTTTGTQFNFIVTR